MPQGDIFVYDCFTGESNFYGYYDPHDPDRAKILYHNSLNGIIIQKKKYGIPLSDAESEFCENGRSNWPLLENDPDQKIFSACCDELRKAYLTRIKLLESKPSRYLTNPEKVFLKKHRSRRIHFDNEAYEALRYWREGGCAEKLWSFWHENSGNVVDMIHFRKTINLSLAPFRTMPDTKNIGCSISKSISISTTLNGSTLKSCWIDFVEMEVLLFSNVECAPFFFDDTAEKLPLFQVRSRREEDFIILTFFEPLPTRKTDVPFKMQWRFDYKDLLYKVQNLLYELKECEEDFPPGVPVQTEVRENLIYRIEDAIRKN